MDRIGNVREALVRARELGCAVQKKKNTNELVITHPALDGTCVVSERRKDTPRHFMTFLERVEDFQRWAGDVRGRSALTPQSTAEKIGAWLDEHPRGFLRAEIADLIRGENGEMLSRGIALLVNEGKAHVVKDGGGTRVLPGPAPPKPVEQPRPFKLAPVQAAPQPKEAPVNSNGNAATDAPKTNRRFAYSPALDQFILSYFADREYRRGTTPRFIGAAEHVDATMLNDTLSGHRISDDAISYHVASVLARHGRQTRASAGPAPAAEAEALRRQVAAAAVAVQSGRAICDHVWKLVSDGDTDTLAAVLDLMAGAKGGAR